MVLVVKKKTQSPTTYPRDHSPPPSTLPLSHGPKMLHTGRPKTYRVFRWFGNLSATSMSAPHEGADPGVGAPAMLDTSEWPRRAALTVTHRPL
jgi:hypothetical protein